MGMFDYLRCELPLPNGQDWMYQTKDTQEWCELTLFVVRADGRLIKHDYDTELTPENELPHKGANREIDQDFDGDVIFYPDVSIDRDKRHDVYYRATFRTGTCKEICQRIEGNWVSVWPDEPPRNTSGGAQ